LSNINCAETNTLLLKLVARTVERSCSWPVAVTLNQPIDKSDDEYDIRHVRATPVCPIGRVSVEECRAYGEVGKTEVTLGRSVCANPSL
jgi:hypothetical protein